MSPRRYLALALLGALLAVTVTGQDLSPPQCDAAEVYYPKNILFMGPAKSIDVGTISWSYHEFGPLLVAEEEEPIGTPPPPPADATPAAVAAAEVVDEPSPVLLIQGFGSTQYEWPLDFLETLAGDRKVVVFDNPRIGWTNDTSDAPLTVNYMANATLELVKALGLLRPDVVGFTLGADVALTMAVQRPDLIGAVAAIAATYGGQKAPQPAGGISAILDIVERIVIGKYQATSQAQAISLMGVSAAATDGSAAAMAPSPASDQPAVNQDPYKLFIPLGVMDPAMCNMLRDMLSLYLAAGLTDMVDDFNGYALPGKFVSEGIIPSSLALAPSISAVRQQKNALVNYFTRFSEVEVLLPTTSTQFLFISGVQDAIVPINTQLELASMTPGSWLQQVPDGGHLVPFLRPNDMAGTVSTFFDSAQDIGSTPRSFYEAPSSAGVFSASMTWWAAAVAAVVAATLA